MVVVRSSPDQTTWLSTYECTNLNCKTRPTYLHLTRQGPSITSKNPRKMDSFQNKCFTFREELSIVLGSEFHRYEKGVAAYLNGCLSLNEYRELMAKVLLATEDFNRHKIIKLHNEYLSVVASCAAELSKELKHTDVNSSSENLNFDGDCSGYKSPSHFCKTLVPHDVDKYHPKNNQKNSDTHEDIYLAVVPSDDISFRKILHTICNIKNIEMSNISAPFWSSFEQMMDFWLQDSLQGPSVTTKNPRSIQTLSNYFIEPFL